MQPRISYDHKQQDKQQAKKTWKKAVDEKIKKQHYSGETPARCTSKK